MKIVHKKPVGKSIEVEVRIFVPLTLGNDHGDGCIIFEKNNL